MAIAVAGSRVGTTAAVSSIAIDVSTLGIQAGDTLVALTCKFNTSNVAILAPSDTGSNTWTAQAASAWDATFRATVGAAWAVVATVPTSVTVWSAATADMSGVVLRLTGAHASAPYDVSAANTATSAAPVSSSVTPAEDNELVIVGLVHDGGDTTLAMASGWTEQAKLESNAVQAYIVGYKLISPAAATTHTWALGASRDAGMAAIAIKPAVAAAGTRPSPVVRGEFGRRKSGIWTPV